jgi:P27 family predicted phage terminase small subunit
MCPTWLDAEAKREWRRVAPVLGKLGVLTTIDRGMLAAYCQAWSDYKATVQAVRKDGKTFVTGQGYVAKNPMVTIMNEAFDRMNKSAQGFGLTPSARTRLETPKSAEDENPVAALMAQATRRRRRSG